MTRSVAEVIGWQRMGEMDETPFFVPRDPADPRTVAARRTFGLRYTPQHTPDDLLAWLREQGCSWASGAVHGSAEDAVWLSVGPIGNLRSYHAPTLLAALERAVIAVAGES